MQKSQRVRDPVHDLIVFDTSDFEQKIWYFLNSREFQRLRRIKQLGFSELVYPGATHSRLAHSLGVFHTARQLSGLVRDRLGGKYDNDRAKIAQAAALVHDVGHGPFSHAFEEAVKQLDKDRGEKREHRHEMWTAEIIRGNTELGDRIRDRFGSDFREQVAQLLLQDTPTDIYSAIVSSQFDADRLDYVRRDRMMTGAQSGGFDYSWLLANLEVAKVTIATDDEEYAEVDSLVLGSKALQAAEAYVLGLFQMYFTVYFHKSTRSAEKMLTAIFRKLGNFVLDGKAEQIGLEEESPVVKFVKERSLDSYIELDDSVVWSALRTLTKSTDEGLAMLSTRLLDRRLYQAIDVSAHLSANEGQVANFRKQLKAAKEAGHIAADEVFEDQPKRNPYKRRGYDTPEALSRVLIYPPGGDKYDDLATMSDVVKSLNEKKIFRAYAKDDRAKKKIMEILEELK